MTKEQVLEKLKFDVELRGLSKNTQDEYYTKAKIFQDYFDVCDNLRDKSILMTVYDAGLLLNEAACLKVSDIDSNKMQLLIRNGNGAKDRYALLSQTNLEILRDYWKAYHPKEWLFYIRENTGTHITSRAVQNIFHKYINKSNITKNVTVHSLRHYVESDIMGRGRLCL